jgi:glucan phosphoethanolaminetransferase (alkaline phosphatase superfamily)
MGLRLFHVTEFAQSSVSPAAQRSSWHPATLLMLAALWLTLAGNAPLWRALAQADETLLAGHGAFALGLYFALLCFASLGLLLTALNWQPLPRIVILVLLWLAALNTELLWAHQNALTLNATQLHQLTPQLNILAALPWWQHLLCFGLIAALPSFWLWRRRVRRVRFGRRLPQNLLLALVWAVLLVALWLAGRHSFIPLLQNPHWLELLTPANTLLSTLP